MARRKDDARVVCYMLFMLLCAVLAGCGRTQQADATISLKVAQSKVGTTPVDVQLHDSKGEPVSGASVKLRGDMTHAGMQPVLVTMDDLGNGQYRAANFPFGMAGDWVLTVDADLPDGKHVERMFDVRDVKE